MFGGRLSPSISIPTNILLLWSKRQLGVSVDSSKLVPEARNIYRTMIETTLRVP
jgi:hypothetical protein